MSQDTVNWGIMGAGRIAHTFMKDAKLVPAARVTGVASRTLATAQNFADTYSDMTVYQNYEQMLADPAIDAIYIASPHTFHVSQCRMAMEAGKHVMCEKPITVSREECESLVSLSEQTGCFFMEALWTYFLPAMRRARQWVEDGRIGKIVQIKGDFGYPIEYGPDKREYNKEVAGGCLLEMGIYPLSFAYYFMHRLPDSMEIEASLAPNGVEDDVMLQASYHSVNAHLATSYKARLPNWGFIVGTQGYIAIPDFFRASKASLHQLDDCLESFDDKRQGSGFEFEISEACQCILRGHTESGIMPHQTSLDLQQQMENIRDRILPER